MGMAVVRETVARRPLQLCDSQKATRNSTLPLEFTAFSAMLPNRNSELLDGLIGTIVKTVQD
jgi:hypothetical protein